jgi:predicted nucleic acid-binding protein
MKQFGDAELIAIVQRLRDLSADWIASEPTGGIASRAERLLLRYGLGAADAIQLASAIATSAPNGSELVSLDRRLMHAATSEGFRIVPDLE